MNLVYGLSVRMRKLSTSLMVMIVALLVPGLVLAAPVAGPCGYCDRGMACPTMAQEEVAREVHGCCDDSADPEPERPSKSLSSCDCGQPVPPAVAADPAPAPYSDSLDQPVTDSVATMLDGNSESSSPVRAPAPPPSPPIFLAACVFLT